MQCRAPPAQSWRCAPAPAPGGTALPAAARAQDSRPRTCTTRLRAGVRPAGFVVRQTWGRLQRKRRSRPPALGHSHRVNRRLQPSGERRAGPGAGAGAGGALGTQRVRQLRGWGSCGSAQVRGRVLARLQSPVTAPRGGRPNGFTCELRRRPECLVSAGITRACRLLPLVRPTWPASTPPLPALHLRFQQR